MLSYHLHLVCVKVPLASGVQERGDSLRFFDYDSFRRAAFDSTIHGCLVTKFFVLDKTCYCRIVSAGSYHHPFIDHGTYLRRQS